MSTIEQTIDQIKAAEVRVWSDSDRPKLKVLLDWLTEQKVLVLERILSAHRTPDRMAEAAKNFPGVNIPWVLENTKLQIALCFAAAWGAAHIAGMTAAETNTPIIAVPVEDSTTGIMASSDSMRNMPPGVPNGFVSNQEEAAKIGARIMRLTADQVQKIYVPDALQGGLKDLIEHFWVEISQQRNESPIGIHAMPVDGEELLAYVLSDIPVMIPTVKQQINYGRNGNSGIIHDNLKEMPWLSMGLQLADKINATNAFLYCMKLVALFNPEVDAKLTAYREKLAKEVTEKDKKWVKEQRESWKLNAALDVALPARYNHIHGGKVRETYENPDNVNELIMIATDRISTHDVVHKNRIPGKGKVLTQVSNYWFDYFKTQEETKDIPTQLVENAVFPADFPEEYKNRAVIVKKLSPLPIEAIMRWRLYGSALDDNKGKKYDPVTGKLATGEFVGKWLKKWSEFNEPQFTPSTKGKVDVNINFEDMVKILETRLQDNYPQWVGRAQSYAEQIRDYSAMMFVTARDHALEKWIILADTKFEFAIDAQGVLHIIDEVLTPDSSRYREAEWYIEGTEPVSFDKQDTRIYVMDTWKKMGKTKEKPSLSLPQEVVEKTQKRYNTIEEVFGQAA